MSQAMEYFNIGRAGGAANAHPLGAAISNIVEDGRKKGLLDQQAAGNLATGIGTAGYKNQLAADKVAAAGDAPEPTIELDKATGKSIVTNWDYDPNTGQHVPRISQSNPENPLNAIIRGATQNVDPNVQGTGTPVENEILNLLKNL